MNKQHNKGPTALSVVAIVALSFVIGFASMAMLTNPTGVAHAAFDAATAIFQRQDANSQQGGSEGSVPAAEVYADVSTNDWYYQSMNYCIEKGIIAGYVDGNFYPNAIITRGMFCLVLWNMEGYPETDYAPLFSDVPPNLWCCNAISWAASAGIVNGCGDGVFRPDESLTREQLATIAWRYLKYKGYIPEDYKESLDPYKDAALIDAYALEAMRWACGTGIMIGTSEDFISPLDSVTRAQLTMFMMRYMMRTAIETPPELTPSRFWVGMEITTQPTKTIYKSGDTFDPDGMVVSALYSDGSKEPMEGYDISPSVLTSDTTYVKITRDGFECSVGVIVDRVLKDIEITTQPTKTIYNAGEIFDPAGMVVTAIYADGGSVEVGGYTVAPIVLTYGTKSVDVTYGGLTKKVDVTVKRVLKDIVVTTQPTKTAYHNGETFDPTGMVVTAIYTDGGSEIITGYTVTPAEMTRDVTAVTVSYGGFSKKIGVTVDRTITGIAVTTQPTKTTYNHGETFNSAGMIVTASYADGGTAEVSGYTVSPTAMTYGTTSVAVTYGGFTANVPVTVNRVLRSIAVVTPPTKTAYHNGETFDPAGMVVAATYTDGETVNITGFSVTPVTMTVGLNSVTVTFGELSVNVGVTVDRVLTGISITTRPAKTTYNHGENFDPSGMVVTASYADGGTAAVTGYTCAPTTLTYGTTSVAVSYNGFTANVPVTVNRTLRSIAVTTQPTKTIYHSGENFDRAGMVVTATYSDSATEAVTGYTINPSALSYDTTSVEISYGGLTTNVGVTVDRVLTGIAVTTQPTKTTYNHGEEFTAAGMVVTASYADGGMVAITGYNVTPTTLTYGTASVAVTYNGFQATVPVTVNRVLTGITITTQPTKTDYHAGENFDPTGMVVTANYSDGSSVIVNDYSVVPTTLTFGTTSVAVNYGGFTANVGVTVDRILTGIAVTTQPTKTTYNHGEEFTAAGMVVTASYADGGTEAVAGYTCTPTTLTYGTTSVAVSYNGFQDTVPVTVNRTLTDLAITTQPTKTSYNVGENFDPTGMVVTATYSDGTTEAVTGYTYAPTGALALGTTSISISFGGMTKTVPVTVSRVLTGIAVTTQPIKTTYNHGEEFTAAGMVVTASYADGGTEAVAGYTCTPTTLTYGTTSVAVSYNGFQDTVPVTVNRTLTDLAITTQPTKTDYNVGENFDPAGMVVTATYSDGTTEAVTGYTYTPTGALALDTTQISVSYTVADATRSTSVAISVGRIALSSVPSQSNSPVFSGSAQSPTWNGYDESKMTLTGSASETNAGTYEVTFTPNADYKWPDGSVTAKTVSWTIAKATPTLTVNPTSVTLNSANTTANVTVSTNSDGALSVDTSASTVATASVTGTTVTVSSVSSTSGSATITVSQAASTNYTAKTATVAVTATFAPAWASSSTAVGSVVTLGTFNANGTALARPTNPTYDGNIHNYSASETYLFGDTSATAANNLQWIKLSDTLLVCDRCILNNISWQNIYKNWTGGYDNSKDTITTQTSIIGAASGTTVTIDGYTYRVRLLTGGATSPGTGSEWDTFNTICAGDNGKMNWQNMYTWCSETTASGYADYRPVRGYGSAADWDINLASHVRALYGFRPVLELVTTP